MEHLHCLMPIPRINEAGFTRFGNLQQPIIVLQDRQIYCDTETVVRYVNSISKIEDKAFESWTT